MRPRNLRPTAWRAGLLLRRRKQVLEPPHLLADLFVLGGALIGGAMGSQLSSSALGAAAYELSSRALRRKLVDLVPGTAERDDEP